MRRLFFSIICLLPALFSQAVQPIVEFVTPSIVRVRWNPDGHIADNATGACVYEKTYVDVKVSIAAGKKILVTDSLEVVVSPEGGITFRDPAEGRILLSENPPTPGSFTRVPTERIIYDEESARMEETANGKVTVKDVLRRDTIGFKDRYLLSFTAPATEAVYGLGSHMEDYMNLVGKTLYLTQHNLKAFVPVIVSTGGYGLLFDAGCSMKYESHLSGSESQVMDITMEAANTVDYYFMKRTP